MGIRIGYGIMYCIPVLLLTFRLYIEFRNRNSTQISLGPKKTTQAVLILLWIDTFRKF